MINLTAHKYENAFPEQFTYLSLSMRDNLNCDMNYYIYAAIEFIETHAAHGNARFLVHCKKGNSRSVAILAAVLMWREHLSDTDALDMIRSRKGFIDPNIGFLGHLQSWHQKLLRLRAGEDACDRRAFLFSKRVELISFEFRRELLEGASNVVF